MTTHDTGQGRSRARRSVRLPVEYRSRSERGSGTLWDVSLIGARVELASTALADGSKVELRFATDQGPVVVWARVSRATETGFGVIFGDSEAALRPLLGELVRERDATPRTAPKALARSERPRADARNARRRTARLRAEFKTGTELGRGLVRNVSQSGAVIANASVTPSIGDRLRVRFRALTTGWACRIACEVVRRTRTGFAVRFVDTEERQASVASAAEFLRVGVPLRGPSRR